jgi:hypothetical protein
MTASVLPVALLIVLGSALTMRSILVHEPRREARPAPSGRCEMNREIERRLDSVVNGSSPLSPTPKPCPSPESWRKKS